MVYCLTDREASAKCIAAHVSCFQRMPPFCLPSLEWSESTLLFVFVWRNRIACLISSCAVSIRWISPLVADVTSPTMPFQTLFQPSQVLTFEQAASRVQDLITSYDSDKRQLPSWTLPARERLKTDAAFETLSQLVEYLQSFLVKLSMLLPDEVIQTVIPIVICVHQQRESLSKHTDGRSPEYILSLSSIRAMIKYLDALVAVLDSTITWIISEEGMDHRRRVNRAIYDMQASLSQFNCRAICAWRPHVVDGQYAPSCRIATQSTSSDSAIRPPLERLLRDFEGLHTRYSAAPKIDCWDSVDLIAAQDLQLLLRNFEPLDAFRRSQTKHWRGQHDSESRRQQAFRPGSLPRSSMRRSPSVSSSSSAASATTNLCSRHLSHPVHLQTQNNPDIAYRRSQQYIGNDTPRKGKGIDMSSMRHPSVVTSNKRPRQETSPPAPVSVCRTISRSPKRARMDEDRQCREAVGFATGLHTPSWTVPRRRKYKPRLTTSTTSTTSSSDSNFSDTDSGFDDQSSSSTFSPGEDIVSEDPTIVMQPEGCAYESEQNVTLVEKSTWWETLKSVFTLCR
ncbi:hypothetical protein AcW1_007298 [Taiwanofungus camphoratus]|nr:hypothetical protein AcV7_004856 [Antrodia cinnamomea]KAI0952949.1 hypothetical protein AcW1_007298 [Antrodia cinnamomea]